MSQKKTSDDFCFSISYIELAATLELSVKGFEFVLENELENIGVQLSGNKFNYQILPYGIVNEYLLKSKLDHTKQNEQSKKTNNH